MAKVFTGKVVIPGDKIDEFFEAMEAGKKAREPFRQYVEVLRKDFEDYLTGKFSIRTLRKHTRIVEMFLEFLYRYTDVKNLEKVTMG